jgi:hypothetical protein
MRDKLKGSMQMGNVVRRVSCASISVGCNFDGQDGGDKDIDGTFEDKFEIDENIILGEGCSSVVKPCYRKDDLEKKR